jgi:hypothetical protein
VFVRAEALLLAPVALVQERVLAELHGDGLHTAAASALDGGQGVLHDAGNVVRCELVAVRTAAAFARGIVTVVPMRWFTSGEFEEGQPTLDANLEFGPTDVHATRLVLIGICHPPQTATETARTSVQQRFARVTAQTFLAQIATLVTAAGPTLDGTAPVPR